MEVVFQGQGGRVVGQPRADLLSVLVNRTTLVELVKKLVSKTSTRTKKLRHAVSSVISLVDVISMMKTSERSWAHAIL